MKQTIGFSWGPAGVSTSLWTGVPLRLLLAASGITEPTERAQYVCFRGPVGARRRPPSPISWHHGQLGAFVLSAMRFAQPSGAAAAGG